MSMNNAVENNLPPHTDAAHRDPAAGTGLRLNGDWTRERDALRKQVEECEDHNTELLAVLKAVRDACEAGELAAKNAIARNSPDSARWGGEQKAYAAIAAIVKPVV